jgi:hypothetical protein
LLLHGGLACGAESIRTQRELHYAGNPQSQDSFGEFQEERPRPRLAIAFVGRVEAELPEARSMARIDGGFWS